MPTAAIVVVTINDKGFISHPFRNGRMGETHQWGQPSTQNALTAILLNINSLRIQNLSGPASSPLFYWMLKSTLLSVSRKMPLVMALRFIFLAVFSMSPLPQLLT